MVAWHISQPAHGPPHRGDLSIQQVLVQRQPQELSIDEKVKWPDRVCKWGCGGQWQGWRCGDAASRGRGGGCRRWWALTKREQVVDDL